MACAVQSLGPNRTRGADRRLDHQLIRKVLGLHVKSVSIFEYPSSSLLRRAQLIQINSLYRVSKIARRALYCPWRSVRSRRVAGLSVQRQSERPPGSRTLAARPFDYAT